MYKVTIQRKTSPYNKYLLWYVSGVADNGAKFKEYTRTLKEATDKYSSYGNLYQIINITN